MRLVSLPKVYSTSGETNVAGVSEPDWGGKRTLVGEWEGSQGVWQAAERILTSVLSDKEINEAFRVEEHKLF